MTKSDIEAFLAVAQSGTISKASEKLYISHSTLSWRIAKLEEEFGVELFSRGKGQKKVELTNAGSAFLPFAVRFLDIWEEASVAMGKAVSTSLNIVIGHNHNLLFTNVYKEFSEQYPDIPLYLLLRHSADAYRYVQTGEVDAGFVASLQKSDKIRAFPLCREKMVFVCGSKYDYRDIPVLSMNDLLTKDEIMWWIAPSAIADWQRNWFGENPQRIVQEDTNALEALLAGSRFWTLVPASTADIFLSRRPGEILSRQLGFGCPGREIFLITRTGVPISNALINFLHIMQRDFTSRGLQWLCDLSALPSV